METHQLLFELSHPVRYEIMRIISREPVRLTKIGEQVDANNPEVSRHLDRLRNSELIEKGSDGRYHISAIGSLVMAMLPGLGFIADNVDWLKKYDVSGLPPSFIKRLGDLTDYQLIEGFMEVTKSIIGIYEAMDQHYRISTHVIRVETIPMFRDKIAEGFDIRFIIDESLQLSEDSLEQISSYGKNWRIIPKIPALFAFSEKSAFVMFPNTMGTYDFSFGFYSDDDAFRKWCEDLFEHLWGMGMNLSDHFMADK